MITRIQFSALSLMSLRRCFARLANAHSKSGKHDVAMQAIFFAWYNRCWKLEATPGQTAAMANGLSEHVWTINELIERAAP
jgi:hypothetical protein